jgi:ribosome maturation factor RimP
MALEVDQIRTTAQRVAASHGLDVVDLEFHGGAKHRILRVFIEKNAEERRRLAAEFDAAANVGAEEGDRPSASARGGLKRVAQDPPHADWLAGVTHTDCEAFSRDFGTVLDVEDLIPGSEYTLEVSSPGLDRKLYGAEDYRRFRGMLAKVQTFEPVAGNRHWQGRIAEVSAERVRLQLQVKAKKSAGRRAESAGKAPVPDVEIALNNIEKAQLVPEI